MPQKKYVYYTLCRICHLVNVPDPPGICSCCLRKTPPRDDFHAKPESCFRTKRNAAKCGTLPWKYRGKRKDKEMCFLSFRGYYISVQRQSDRRFCYIVGNKKESVFRKNISELTFARTRSVRHLAKILNMDFDELVQTIKAESQRKKAK